MMLRDFTSNAEGYLEVFWRELTSKVKGYLAVKWKDVISSVEGDPEVIRRDITSKVNSVSSSKLPATEVYNFLGIIYILCMCI